MNLITNLLGKPNDFFINLGNHAFFGDGAYIKDISFNYNHPIIELYSCDSTYRTSRSYKQPIEISITAVAPDVTMMFGKINKVSIKQVKDCSIDELIFAIREKIKRGEV